MCTCDWKEDRGALLLIERCPHCEAIYRDDGEKFNKAMRESQLIAEELQELAKERLKAKGRI